MNTTARARYLFLACAAAFAALCAAVGLGFLRGFDLWTLEAGQSAPSAALDAAGNLLSVLGSIEVTGAAMAGLVLLLFVLGNRRVAARLAVAFGATGLIEVVLKLLLPQPPMPENVSRSATSEAMLHVPFPHPYPSGHMLRTVLLLGALVLLWKRGGRRALLLLAAFGTAGMALTRVYLGVHWATDVLGGALLGAAGLAWAFGGRGKDRRPDR